MASEAADARLPGMTEHAGRLGVHREGTRCRCGARKAQQDEHAADASASRENARLDANVCWLRRTHRHAAFDDERAQRDSKGATCLRVLIRAVSRLPSCNAFPAPR